MKKHTLLQWILLASVISVGAILNVHLKNLREELRTQNVPKFTVTDINEFDKLCKQLTSQWGTKKYAVYLMQPNSPVKTHKELVTSTIDGLPFITSLYSYNKLAKFDLDNIKTSYFVGTYDEFMKIICSNNDVCYENINIKSNDVFVMLPIYKHAIVVGEMYIIFEDVVPKDINFHIKSLELQQLSTLIQ